MLTSATFVAETWFALVPERLYLSFEPVARRRVPRDPRDWPTVALALALGAGIWTEDGDFLGCGLPTWTTATLAHHLGEAARP